MLIAKVDKIIELRKARGLNQKKLSEKAGLPVNAVFRIETGAYTRTQDLRAKRIHTPRLRKHRKQRLVGRRYVYMRYAYAGAGWQDAQAVPHRLGRRPQRDLRRLVYQLRQQQQPELHLCAAARVPGAWDAESQRICG